MVQKTIYALVDCNNFYASCERLFRPDLKNKPIVVLSNNDGCVVARSHESKALGIKMGVPFYQIQAFVKQQGIQVFSSNYALYGDISNRVMQTLESFVPTLEVYSIDEAFVEITGLDHIYKGSWFDIGLRIKALIEQWVGVPVCVGIAPTKTLAKLANHAAKHYPATQGVVDLTLPTRQRKLMQLLSVNEVWGVGYKTARHLHDLKIFNALDLADTSLDWIQSKFSVLMARTVSELNGEPCLELDDMAQDKKHIVVSRSFGVKVTRYSQMYEAIAEYISRAASKLRLQNQVAKYLTVYIRTSNYTQESKNYRDSASMTLLHPTADSRKLIELAEVLLKRIWQNQFSYAKAGVVLSDFYDADKGQLDLFNRTPENKKNQNLMKIIDQLNQQQNKTVVFAAQGLKQLWAIKREHLSPAYTTNWQDIPIVR